MADPLRHLGTTTAADTWAATQAALAEVCKGAAAFLAEEGTGLS